MCHNKSMLAGHHAHNLVHPEACDAVHGSAQEGCIEGLTMAGLCCPTHAVQGFEWINEGTAEVRGVAVVLVAWQYLLSWSLVLPPLLHHWRRFACLAALLRLCRRPTQP